MHCGIRSCSSARQTEPRLNKRVREGFTVVELLVTITLLAILMSLLVPAVQAARSSARAIHCRNNFRQVSIALQNYISVYQQIPRTHGEAMSSFVHLLPYLEHAALYDMLTGRAERIQRSAIKNPAVFRCSEDPVVGSRSSGTNIGENIGICHERSTIRGVVTENFDGVFLRPADRSVVTPGTILDGMSNTAAYSEILGYPRPGYSRRIYTHMSDEFPTDPAPVQAEWCRKAEVGIAVWTLPRGSDWISGMIQVNQYVHALPPNERDCLFTPGSASEHRGGVHTALCDGSVRFVSSSVNDAVWQAIGSRDAKDGPIEW
jgi:prepilin-type N-terminal cleavage/methylation domain-containing protein